MAFEKWKNPDGDWNNAVVATVACFGVLLYVGLYFYFTDGRHVAPAEYVKRDNLLVSATSSETR